VKTVSGDFTEERGYRQAEKIPLSSWSKPGDQVTIGESGGTGEGGNESFARDRPFRYA
jgi:hypothetical protein